MKTLEFYATAQRDPLFCREHREAARYQMKVATGLMIVCAALWLTEIVCFAVVEKRWAGEGAFAPLLLSAMGYGQAREKTGALAAMAAGEPAPGA